MPRAFRMPTFGCSNSRRGDRDPEEPHLMRERLAKTRFERPRIEPERSTGLLVAPEVGDPCEIAESFGARQSGDSSKEPRRDLHPWRGDSRDPFGNLEGLDERMPGSREDVRFSRNSLLHREELPAGRVLDLGPAVGHIFWWGVAVGAKRLAESGE